MFSSRRLLVLLLLCASPAFGAVAHVKSGALGGSKCSGTGTTKTCTYTNAFAASSTSDVMYIGTLSNANTTATAVSISATNWTFTAVSGVFGVSGNWSASFCATTTSTANTTFTVTWTVGAGSAGTFGTIGIDEFSGGAACNAIDNHKEVGTNTTTITPVANNCAIWAWNADSNTSNAANGYSAGSDDLNQDFTDYKILTGGGGASQNVNGFSGGSGTVEMAVITIAPSGGGGGTVPPPQLMNMGVGMVSMSIDYPALAAWQGCAVGDTSCSMEVDLCDENNNCLHFPPGSHKATLNFVKGGTSTVVGSAAFSVTTQ